MKPIDYAELSIWKSHIEHLGKVAQQKIEELIVPKKQFLTFETASKALNNELYRTSRQWLKTPTPCDVDSPASELNGEAVHGYHGLPTD